MARSSSLHERLDSSKLGRDAASRLFVGAHRRLSLPAINRSERCTKTPLTCQPAIIIAANGTPFLERRARLRFYLPTSIILSRCRYSKPASIRPLLLFPLCPLPLCLSSPRGGSLCVISPHSEIGRDIGGE